MQNEILNNTRYSVAKKITHSHTLAEHNLSLSLSHSMPPLVQLRLKLVLVDSRTILASLYTM